MSDERGRAPSAGHRRLVDDGGSHDRHHHDRPTFGPAGAIEIVFYRSGDDIYLSGIPAPTTRHWLANLAAHAQFTFHLKHDVVADLPATATVIVDPAERRRVLAAFVEEFNRRHGPGQSLAKGRSR